MSMLRSPYIGHPSQLLRVQDYRMIGGQADGVRATDISNGAIQLTVCADRCMDFPYLRYRGTNLGYLAPCGIVGPQYYDSMGTGFLRGFGAGFLTTCGLSHMGAPCEWQGQHWGMHGRVSYLPAERYAATVEEQASEAVVEGTMRQGTLFGEHLTLTRRIRCGLDEKGFSFSDTVRNHGFHRQRHMILYHFNLGYPLLDKGAMLHIPADSAEPRNEHAQAGLPERLRVTGPVAGYREMCYFYRPEHDSRGRTRVGLYNHRLALGVGIEYDGALLDHFTQWKLLGEGEYVMGLEPGNATPLGVAEEEKLGHVKYLEPGQTVTYAFRIQVLDGVDSWNAYRTFAGEK